MRALVSTVLVLGLAACGGGGGSGSSDSGGSSGGSVVGGSGPNVQPIVVNPGPAQNYANGAFTSVTVCVPGTSECQTIDGVLVDTGSSGLRLLSSLLTVSLPPQHDAAGAPILECNQFQDSYQWGAVVLADLKMSGEQASSVPIQAIGTSAFGAPKGCTQSGLPPQETVDSLGANGVLGVGLFRQDCGPACASSGGQNPGLYYSCPPSGCVAAAVGLNQQVLNPVWLFAADNNGVILQLPSVPAAGAPTVNGSMIFGIGTRSNNGLGSAHVYTVDDVGYFTTVFKGQPYSQSFVDSGSNGIFFLDSATSGLAACRDTADFYCPPAPASLTATNRDASGTSATVDFTIANADALFNTPNFAFSNLGGPNPGSFDWGLPFFFGRNVYTALEQQSTPGGVGPYFAY
ncbi:MAG TPA: DUF3443 domain-containing protein [Vicinamibacteria bacterium]|nr:DUF3443 domain-containing protein [Vicinamibacteria bacterium]